jgi:uncharacterized membrane protein
MIQLCSKIFLLASIFGLVVHCPMLQRISGFGEILQFFFYYQFVLMDSTATNRLFEQEEIDD